MRSILNAVILFCALCAAQAPSGFAAASQNGAAGTQAAASASVQGKVSDSTGAVLVGAKVIARSATGTTVTAATSSEGKFVLRGLTPGPWDIEVSAPKFETQKTEGFNVEAGDQNILDIQLNPAGEASTIEVAAQTSTQIETEHAELAGTISEKQITNVGLNGRNFSQLVALTPGVSNQTQQDEAKVGVVGSAKYSVNGGRTEYNAFDIDGGDVLNTGIAASRGHSTLTVYPSLDAIAEIKVLTSNYGAQYGRSASGTTVVTTKSGGATFHGNGYEFLRNESLNARGFKDPAGPAPLYRRQDFGFTLGGPIYIPNRYNQNKDKSFFFYSEEFRLERSPTSFSQAVPSLNEREGNFSDVCSASGSGADCPHVPGISFSSIPIDPNARAILQTNLIPLANSSFGCSYSLSGAVTDDPATWPCYIVSVSPDTYWREELFRIDHNLTPSVKASLRYIHDDWNTIATTPQWQYGGVTNSFPTVMNRFIGPGLSIVGHVTAIKSPSLVNDYSVSYVTQHVSLTNLAGPGADLTRPARLDATCGALENSCGIGYIFPGSAGKIPGINIGGANSAYGGPGFLVDTSYMPWHNANPTITVRDDLNKSIGKHLFQAGVLFVDAQQSEISSATGANTGNVQGLINYTNVTASNLNTTGNAFADFLLAANLAYNNNSGNLSTENALGQIVSYQQDSSQQFYANKYEMIEPYLQDDWQVRPGLTVNLGLRVSLFGNWTPNGSAVYNFVPSQFSSSVANTLRVDPNYGYLRNASTGAAILANATAPAPATINGLVQCGVNGVPASCMDSHFFNPSPRVGVAWDPTGKGTTSIRAGYGVFFEHGTGDEANSGSLTGSVPLVQSMTENAPIGNSFRLECIDGRAPGCAATVPAGAAFPLDVSAIPTHNVWPYVQQWSLSTQLQINKDTIATAAYVGSKGTHLATVRQLNQLDPVPASDNYFAPHEPIRYSTGANADIGVCSQAPIGPPSFETTTGYYYYQSNPAYVSLGIACSLGVNANSVRKYPGYGRILSIENLANSSYNALQMTLHHVRGPLNLGVTYSYSHSIDQASDRFESSLGNSLDTRSNRASSSFDERHILNLSYVVKLHLDRLAEKLTDHGECGDGDDLCRIEHPAGSGQPPAWFKKAISGWELSGLTVYQSGIPFTVVNGASGSISSLDNAGVANGLGAGSYPDVVPAIGHCYTLSGNSPSSQVIGPLLGDRCRFVAPRGLTFGNAGRNYLNNPSRINHDAALHRYFNTWHETHLEFRFEVFNILNHTQYRIYDPEKGNTASNTISCYGDVTSFYSAGANSCDAGNAFLHPVDAHRPRTMQLGVKLDF